MNMKISQDSPLYQTVEELTEQYTELTLLAEEVYGNE
jgi:hypothetical protein